MTLATATSALESRFDSFLYATVREDPEGAPLTVLSVLARLDIDPWEEAARLAKLPGEVAARALAGRISSLPMGSATSQDSGTIALRLISLLPGRSQHAIAAKKARSNGPDMSRTRDRAAIVSQAVLGLIFLAVLLLSQWIVVNHLASVPVQHPVAASTRALSAPPARPDAAP
ncbi:MAG: hypothetical protein ACYCT1_11810 [Steroidobacteraceae bacterium]